MGWNLTQPSAVPFVFDRGPFWMPCSTETFAGTHQWRLRMIVKSKHSLDNSDRSPFLAHAQVERSLTCQS